MSAKLTIDLDEYFAVIGRKGPPKEYDLVMELITRKEPALNPNWDGSKWDENPTFSVVGCSLLDSEGDFVDFLDMPKKKTFLYGQLVTWDRKAAKKYSILIGGILVDNWLVTFVSINLISSIS